MWVGLAGAVAVLVGSAYGGLLVRAVLLDVLSLWPGLALSLVVLVIRSRMTRYRRTFYREAPGAAIPFVLLTWLVFGLGLHLTGWEALPSSAADLSGPPVDGTIAGVVLDLHTDGQVTLDGNGGLLYEVGQMAKGGDVAPARSSEMLAGDEVAVRIGEESDPGWFGSAGWNVSISASPEWSVNIIAQSVEADLTAVRLTSLRVSADGRVRLADADGDIPVFLGGTLVLEIPADASVEVTGSAQVGPGWEVTATGKRFEGTGTSRFLVEVDPGSDLVVEQWERSGRSEASAAAGRPRAGCSSHAGTTISGRRGVVMDSREREAARRFEWLRGLGIAAWSIVGACLVLALLAWLVLQLRIIWPPLIFAVIIVYLFKPLVDRLERHKVPRVAGGCLAYVLFGALLVLIGVLIVPVMSNQAVELVDQVPEVIDSASQALSDVASMLNLPESFQGVESFSVGLREWFADPANREVILEGIGRVGEIARGVLEVAIVVLLAPVLAFYILVDAHNLRRAGERLIPAADRDEVVHLARQIGKAVGGFIRGQLMVALVVGVLSSLALRILDLPFWLIVGLLAGLLNIVPFIGPWVGGALGVSTALIVGDPIRAIWVVVAFLAIQQIDNHLVSPLILRVAVHLSPVSIILALLAGGSIGGLFGVLIAVPVTAVLKIVAGHLWRTRVLRESWDEAVQAVMVEYEPEPLKERFRRGRTDDSEAGDLADDAADPIAGHETDHGDIEAPVAEASYPRED